MDRIKHLYNVANALM